MHDIEDSQMICEISSKHRGFIVIFLPCLMGKVTYLINIADKRIQATGWGGVFFPVDTDHISFYECISQEELI